eukprot:GHRR01036595.1.p1 GENE.GHRR01036595.1~~GHRR01036595.1.p1  ORF type:complete len:119 (-),score=8.02 GHRR01036595.1:177-533(-)
MHAYRFATQGFVLSCITPSTFMLVLHHLSIPLVLLQTVAHLLAAHVPHRMRKKSVPCVVLRDMPGQARSQPCGAGWQASAAHLNTPAGQQSTRSPQHLLPFGHPVPPANGIEHWPYVS